MEKANQRFKGEYVHRITKKPASQSTGYRPKRPSAHRQERFLSE
jgi:hypothetical protein